MIDHATVERILDAARIEEVVSDFVTLKRRGANYIACCPFHHEKTPSFSVSPSKGIYKCFGCGKAGSTVSFVMEHEQMSYVEALKYLGRKYGIEVKEKEESEEDVQQRLHHESLLIVNDFAQKFYTEQLLKTDEGIAIGLSYFKERGFTDETINKFLLGYAPNKKREFTHNAQRKGYKKEHMVEVGLTIERENGELVDRYYDRVIFPIRGISGKVIAFGGRKLRNDKEVAKYINSPESEVYVKNKVLYGIYEAKQAIAKEQKCYLVEGYTDVISFHQAGVENVVSSSGTSLTTGQIQLIKRFTNNVTVLYDGDWAGIKASLRGIDMLLEEGLEIKVALFPNGEDPDSFARKHTREELLEFLSNNEEDFISFKQRILTQELNKDPLQRAKLIGEVVSSIAVIPDAIVRAVYIEQTAAKLNIKEDLLQQEVAKQRHKKQSEEYYQQKREQERQERLQGIQAADSASTFGTAQTAAQRSNIPGFVVNTYCSEAEKEILYYLLKFGYLPIHVDADFAYGAEDEEQTVAQYILSQLQNDELELQNLQYKEIFNEYFQLKDHESEKVLRYFMNHPSKEVSSIVADLFIQPYTLTIQQFSKSIIPERNVLGRVVPKSILIYKAKVTAQAAMNLTEELGKAQKEKNVELQNELMAQLSTLMQVRNFFSKELNRIIL